MCKKDEFYTLNGYRINEKYDDEKLTSSMEDYLEMICRLSEGQKEVRIGTISEKLHVKPSSASKMMLLLKEKGYISFEKYGHISISEKGLKMGGYLLYRHKVINEFLCALNNSDTELEQTEKIEHFINKKTVENLKKFTDKLKNYNK
ncbi:MAG: metal-dependent transcriptional regulator [Clostridia bacterium]|nr:metal-dependent transcriptional regulator [Clostridia bacterium]MCI2014501.1 metal-dependent transcriptional regulator [Clostridia bacterium]